MYYEAVEINYLHDYILEIKFKDGKKGKVDFSEYVKKGGVFRKFSDINFFREVTINPEFGFLTWPENIDVAPETLYAKATGEPLPSWMQEKSIEV